MSASKKPEYLKNLAEETLAVHAARHLDSGAAVAPPIYQTATFRGFSTEDFAKRSHTPRHDEFYTRYGNPTLSQAEAVLAALEGAESALLTASGMAAVTSTVLTLVNRGDHIVAQTNHYGGTYSLLNNFLPRFGVESTQVDQRDTAAFERALKPNTKLIIVESPSNPVMRLTDLRAVAKLAKSRGITTLMDGTFATPLNQRPLEMGLDLVFHSATKYFGGHSDLIAGVVMGPAARLEKIWSTHSILGGCLAPFDAWLVLRGLRTLPIRVRQHNENALAVARFLEKHPKIDKVHYPGLQSHPQHDLAKKQMSGFGGMLSFEAKGGEDAANRFLSRVRLASRAPSLGGVETLVVHAALNFSHYLSAEAAAEIGITPGLVRVSVGLENSRDLIADFDQALG